MKSTEVRHCVELFSKDDCHLCDAARIVLKKIQTLHSFDFIERHLDEQSPLHEQFKEKYPVVFVDGVEICYGCVDVEKVSKAFQRS